MNTVIKLGVVVTEPLDAFQDLPHLFVGREARPCERCGKAAHAAPHAVNGPHLERLLKVWEQEAN